MNVSNMRNYENTVDVERLFRSLVNQPEELTRLMQFAIQNNAWRASRRELVEKLVEKLSNEKTDAPLEAKGEEVKKALSEIRSKLLEDRLNQVHSIDAYIAFVEQNQGQIKTIDLTKFSDRIIRCRPWFIEDHHIHTLIEYCPTLHTLNLASCQRISRLDLSGLKNLRELDLGESSIKTLIGLSDCPNLKTLHLNSCQQLEELDVSGLGSLEKLDLSDSLLKTLTGLWDCTALKKLNLRFCRWLKELDISGLIHLEELDLNGSSIEKLTGLSDCIALNELNLSACESLKFLDVRGLRHLKELDLFDSSIEEMKGLSECENLKSLALSYLMSIKTVDFSELKGLEHLVLTHSSLEEVIGLNDCKNLKTFYLSFCRSSKELNVSGLKNLEKLNLSDSSIENVVGLSDCTNLKKLYIDSCESPKKLNVSGLRNLKKLELVGSLIEEIAGLSTLTSLQQVSIDRCSRLASLDLSDLHQLERVYSNRCPLLRSLGEALSNCIQIQCEGCPQLINLPQVPFFTTVITDSTRFTSFSVDPKELEEKPLQVLLKLGTHLLANQPMPNIVWLDPHTREPQAGIDAGGLRRQLVATLSKNVFEEKTQQGFRFPFTKTLEGKWFLDPVKDQKSIVALRTVARLIALCFHSSLLLGADLPAHFFYALGALSDKEIDAIPLNQPLDAKLKERLYPKMYSALLGVDSLSEEDVKEMNRSSILYSLAIVAKELKQALGTLSLLRNNTEAFIDRVQGKPVTKESFFKCLQFTNDINNQMQHYFKTYLDKLELEKVKDLLELFTACRTLGEHPITVHVFPSRKTEALPAIHTCSQEIEMPSYISYEQFEEKIEKSFYSMRTFAVA